jgi:RNA polymerase sigma-70 factor (ECF subfamily)
MSTATVFGVTNEPLAQEFDEIFREHSQMVYRTAFSVTGSPQDAEDVLQGVFLWLLRRGIPPGLKENPRAYLYRAAINLSLNTLRSRRRHVLTDDHHHLESLSPSPQDNPNEGLETRLADALSQLSPRAVEMLILRYEHNYSDAEIGKMLGASRGTIAVTLYRARARLKKLIKGSDGEKP